MHDECSQLIRTPEHASWFMICCYFQSPTELSMEHDREAAKVLSRLLELNDRLIEMAPSYAKTTFALIRCETLARLGEHERAASEVEKLFANNQIITSRLDYDFQWQSSRWTHSASVLALCSHMARTTKR